MQAYTVEPLYVKSGQDVIAADFYRPKNIRKTSRDPDGPWSGGLTSI